MPDADTMPPVLLSEETIQRRIRELGAQITHDYEGRDPVVMGVLVGAFVFMADLVRSIRLPVHVEFVRASSYGNNRHSSGDVRLTPGSWDEITGRDVLVVEDVLDTGRTLAAVIAALGRHGARSIRSVVLLRKPQTLVGADYVGFDIDRHFVVGYGLDDGGKWRHLPYIGYVTAP